MGRKALTQDKSGRGLIKQASRDKAVTRFIEGIDFDRLERILAADSRYHLLLQMMHDPLIWDRGRTLRGGLAMSFAAVMRKAKVDLGDLEKAYIEGSKQLCMLELANRLPAIGASVAENATNRDESCPSCGGAGTLPLGQITEATDIDLDSPQCKTCKGSGLIRVMGDKHSIDTVGKWLKLEGDKSGVTINNLLSQNANFGGGQDRIEDLLSKTAQVINVEAREVEAE